MKLGNYKWKLCSKCGQKYTVVNGKNDEHKCDSFKCQQVETIISELKIGEQTPLIEAKRDEVEIRALYKIPSLKAYEKWTKVSRFLAYGLQGIEIREIK